MKVAQFIFLSFFFFFLFIEALFIIDKEVETTQQRLNEWMNKMGYTRMMEYYSAIKGMK